MRIFAAGAVAAAVVLSAWALTTGGQRASGWQCTPTPETEHSVTATRVRKTRTPTAVIATETPVAPSQTPDPRLTPPAAATGTPGSIWPPETGNGGQHDDDEERGCILADGTVILEQEDE